MRIAFLAASMICAIAGATSAHANSYDYSNPYDDEVRPGLHFADLEAGMVRDPLTWSSDPGWEAHHTPARFMAAALGEIRAAVPAGTLATEAAGILHAAGARCAPPTGAEMTCRYRDTEFPDGGDYTDNVTWQIHLPVSGGQIGEAMVTRDWTRR